VRHSFEYQYEKRSAIPIEPRKTGSILGVGTWQIRYTPSVPKQVHFQYFGEEINLLMRNYIYTPVKSYFTVLFGLATREAMVTRIVAPYGPIWPSSRWL
jgi:hypothetical protein